MHTQIKEPSMFEKISVLLFPFLVNVFELKCFNYFRLMWSILIVHFNFETPRQTETRLDNYVPACCLRVDNFSLIFNCQNVFDSHSRPHLRHAIKFYQSIRLAGVILFCFSSFDMHKVLAI